MLKNLLIGVAFLALIACGGGGNDGSSGPTVDPSTGNQLVQLAPGDNKTIHASNGDFIELHCAKHVHDFSLSFPTGEKCDRGTVSRDYGLLVNVRDFTDCIFNLTFDGGGSARLEILPLSSSSSSSSSGGSSGSSSSSSSGGSSGSSSSSSSGGTSSSSSSSSSGGTATGPSVTVGSTTVAAGESKTIHAAVGDTLTFHGTETFSYTQHGVNGNACGASLVGFQSSTGTVSLKISSANPCVLQFQFTAGTAEFELAIP